MKYLLLILLFFGSFFSTKAQYPGGMDSTSFNGRRALYKIPSGTGPFGLMIEWGPTAESLDGNPAGLSGLYVTGTPKLIVAGGNPYFLKGNGDSAKYIFVKIQRGAYSDDAFSDDMSFTLPAIFSFLGSHLDTTKYADGTYKYVGMVGEERGSDIIFNSITQNLAANNCFYHASPGWIFNHIKKLYVARINDVCQYGSYDPTAAYNHVTTKQLWYYRVNGASTIEPAMQTNLGTYSPGVDQKLTNFAGLTNTQLSDTLYSTRGLYNTNNIFRDLLDDSTNKPPPNYIAKVYTIIPFSQYAQHDPNAPQNFFDGYLVADPKNGVLTDTTHHGNPQNGWDTTGGAPLKDQYTYAGDVFGTKWPGNRKIRLILDFGGATNIRDTTKKFSFTDAYGLSGEEIGHSMLLYNADILFKVSIPEAIMMLSRPDSLMTPFATLTTTGYGAGWTNISLHDSMRYMLVVITTTSSHPSQFNELVFYGHDVDTTGRSAYLRPPTYLGPLPKKIGSQFTFSKLMGTNIFQGLSPNSIGFFGDVRLYTGKYYYDVNPGRAVPDTLLFWYSIDVNPTWAAAMRDLGNRLHYTNQGSNQYAAAQGSQIDIDSSGLDPEWPWNYLRAGDFAFWWARKFGRNTATVTPNKWRQDAGFTGNGLNLFRVAEFGNEVEGHGQSYMGMFMKLSMEWDGHCGMYGVPGKTGIKNGDSTMLLSTPGMIDPDTSFIKAAAFLTALTRPDGVIPFQVFAAHRYFTQKDTTKGIYHSLEEQIGIRGEAPEWFNGYQKGWLKYSEIFARNAYKWLPLTTEFDLTEQGWGNCNMMIANTGEAASIYDIYPWIVFDGLTVHQSKAKVLDRMELLTMASPWIAYNNYAVSNQFGDTNNSVRFLFYADGIAAAISGFPFDFTVKYAGFYHHVGFHHQLHDYYFDGLIQDGGRNGVWLLRFRNAYRSDSVAYTPWLGSYTGVTLPSQTINFGLLNGQSVRKWAPSDTDTTGTSTSLTAIGGFLTSQTITEQPVIYFAKEVVAYPWIWKPRRNHIKSN